MEPPTWELVSAIALLVMSSSALFPLLYGSNTVESDSSTNVLLRYLWTPVYGLTVLLAALRWRRLKWAAPALAPSLTLLIFAAVSVFWSIAPETTVRRSEALGFNILLSFYLAARFSWADLVRMISASLVILAAGSLVMCLAFPGLGIHAGVNAGAWRGLWLQKNELGFMMVTGTLSSLASAAVDARRRFAWLAGAALCCVLLVLSRSGTSLLCLMSSGSLWVALGLSRNRPVVAVLVTFLAGCFALALAIVMMTDLDFLVQVMGKDTTLTGRTDVWAAVMRRIAERPALGFGYQAFWHDEFGPARLVRRETGWAVPTAHNGWLEVLLQLGWAGASLVAMYFVVSAVAAARNLFSRRDGFWAVMYGAAFLLLSFSEGNTLKQNSLEWILFMVTSTKLAVDVVSRARPLKAQLPRTASPAMAAA